MDLKQRINVNIPLMNFIIKLPGDLKYTIAEKIARIKINKITKASIYHPFMFKFANKMNRIICYSP